MNVHELQSRLADAQRLLAATRIRIAANAVIVEDDRTLLVQFAGGTEAEHYNFPGAV